MVVQTQYPGQCAKRFGKRNPHAPDGNSLNVLSKRAGIEIGGVIIFTVGAIVAVKVLVDNAGDYFVAFRLLCLTVLSWWCPA